MAGSIQALDILLAPDEFNLAAPSLVVLHGEEQFLTLAMLDLLRARLCPDEADWAWAWREFDGSAELDPREVFDEAATIPMFGTASRTAVVRQADAFVTAARDRLEAIATAARGRRGLVILAVKSFPSNTRLAKAVAKQGWRSRRRSRRRPIWPAGSAPGRRPATASSSRRPRPSGCLNGSAASSARSIRLSPGSPPPPIRGPRGPRSNPMRSTTSPARPRSEPPGA